MTWINPFGVKSWSHPFEVMEIPYGYDDIPNVIHVYEPARRALSSYTGNLLRLRRDSDDAESNFGYVEATGELDKAAIATWLDGADGHVVTIYDQKGSDDVTQATADNQPLYVSDMQNGHAGMSCASDHVVGTMTTKLGTGARTVTLVLAAENNAMVYPLYIGESDTGKVMSLTPEYAVRLRGGNRIFDQAASTTVAELYMLFAPSGLGASDFEARVNGQSVGVSSTGTLADLDTSAPISIGAPTALSPGAYSGEIASVVVCDENLALADKLALELAINRFWSLWT